MSDTTEDLDAPAVDDSTVDGHQAATAEQPETTETTTTDTAADGDAGLSRRDRRYREQLRTAEAERDTLQQRVEAMQRSEVERLAAEHLTKPAALWTAGVELASLVGEDGTVDADLVLTAVQDAREQLGLEDPQAQRRRSPVVTREGTSVQSGGDSGSWSDAFKR